jgi:methylenetetrahydrofolate reductase (NADPH)
MMLPTAVLPASAGPWHKPSLRWQLESSNRFLFCAELVTSRGMITEQSGRRVLELARSLAEHPAISALSITDNPGGKAMLSPDTLGTDLISRGQEVIIHLSCKDWNRNALQSRGWKLASEGFHNVLALSGDCPSGGYNGHAAGVFDIDSVGLLKMFSEMNSGTQFFLGAVVNNYKRYEREVMPQYFKLARKIREGAAFVINQVGYDARKMDELLKYMHLHGMNVPVLANVYVLSTPAARYFHAGRIPGCVVHDDLMALCEKQGASPDRGKAFFLEFAAKQCAIAKGLGFRGAYLGGHLKFIDYERILAIVESYGEDDWKLFTREIAFHYPDEFYYFEPEGATELSSMEISRAYLRSKTPRALAELRQHLPLSYKLNRLVHEKIFEPGSAGFRGGAAIAVATEGSEVARKALHAAEQAFKILSFDCRDCGDCSLPDIAYLCPESQCAKNQRNGPCGGTREGKCEVGEKECIWGRAYDRLKAYGEEVNMLDGPTVFRESALKGTSAWANTFLKRDHHAREGHSNEAG